jgi:hypothetical protein
MGDNSQIMTFCVSGFASQVFVGTPRRLGLCEQCTLFAGTEEYSKKNS